MKHPPLSPSRSRLAILAAVFGFMLAAASAAHAFTIDNQSNTHSDGSARYTDPDEQFSGTGTGNNQTILRQGDATLRFGGNQGSFDQRYNANQVFDSLTQSGNNR